MARKPPRKLIEAVLAAGWTIDRTGQNHIRMTPPPGTKLTDGTLAFPITMASSCSDVRANRNIVSRLRRAGVHIDSKVGR